MKKKKGYDKINISQDTLDMISNCNKILCQGKIDDSNWNNVVKLIENKDNLLDNYPTSEAVTTPLPF